MVADRSIHFNNAGARMLIAGQKNVALDLFRGALESKLAFERTHRPGDDSLDQASQRCVTPDCVSLAETHLANLGHASDASMEGYIDIEGNENVPVSNHAVTGIHSNGVIPRTMANTNQLYLYQTPFELTEGNGDSTQRTSAVIVFNLGLVHQLSNPTSPKTAAFYEIAAALLSDDSDVEGSRLLRIAILNNFGVWCHHFGDFNSQHDCMQQLDELFRIAGDIIESEVKHAIEGNIQILLRPNSRHGLNR